MSGVFELGVSDHCPIVCVRDVRIKRTASQVVSKRNFRTFDAERFLEDLKDVDWSFIGLCDNVEVALDSFATTFNDFVDKHAPYKKSRIKDRVVPWVTQELSTLLINRNSAWSRARRTGDPDHWLSFRQLRNKCTTAVRKAKTEYFLNLVTNSYSNPAKFWGAINMTKSRPSNALPLSITVNDCVISGPVDIRHAFNKHFLEAGKLFDKLFPGPPPTKVPVVSPPPDRASLFAFQPFMSSEILRILLSIDPKSSTGEDHLDPYFIKLAAPAITEPLSYIFNLSISSGIFPLVRKSARVIPLHKGGDRDNLDNYRPISTLPCLAKVLETLVNSQLKSFLSSHSILSPHQSGFRPNHSTITAITLVTNDITSALDRRKHCAALFVDLSKAFDTVDHQLLLKRLSDIGLDMDACAWFHGYLSSRRQCVKSPLGNSEFLPISKGVPQGSVLGPVLFTIYINEMVSSITGCCAHLYADDAIIHCTADTPQAATDNLQLSFYLLQDTLADLKLVLNSQKSKFMLFSRAKTADLRKLHILTADGSLIERVSEYLKSNLQV